MVPMNEALIEVLIRTQQAQEAGNTVQTNEIRFEGKVGTEETRQSRTALHLTVTRTLLTA